MASDTPNMLDLVQTECLELLLALAAYDAHTATPWAKFESRSQIHFHSITARELETMLALRICRFDDEASNQISLRVALRSVENNLPKALTSEIRTKVKTFRATINPIKTNVRNKYGAHRDVQTDAPQDPSAWAFRVIDSTDNKNDSNPSSAKQIEKVGIGAIRSAVGDIVKIIDLMSEVRCGYSMKSGSVEIEVDLRVLCGIEDKH